MTCNGKVKISEELFLGKRKLNLINPQVNVESLQLLLYFINWTTYVLFIKKAMKLDSAQLMVKDKYISANIYGKQLFISLFLYLYRI